MVCAIAFNAVTTIASPSPGTKAPRTSVNEKYVPLGAQAVGQTQRVDVGIDAEMVGVSWAGGQAATFSVRGLQQSGAWTDWMQLDASLGDQPDKGPSSPGPAPVRTTAGPAWVADDVRVFEVRLDSGAPTNVKLHALDVKSPTSTSTGFALGPSPAAAETGAPFIASRAMWGADESFRNMYPNCTTPDYASSVDFAVIHHTVNSNNYGPGDAPALIRGIYYFHTHDNGWCDIGYNFLIDRFGQIWEGRYGGGHMPVIASHAGGFNAGSTGISMLGNYDVASVPVAAYLSLVDLIAWKFKYHGVDPNGFVTRTVAESDCNCQRWPPGTVVTIPTIVGHTDVDGTSCPGRFLYPLIPQIRRDVAAIVNAPENADAPVTCDWNHDGRDTTALFQNGFFYIRQSNSAGPADLVINYGAQGYVPLCGDWNGDGIDTIGVYFNGWWYLRNSNSPGPPDIVVHYGAPGYTPVVGNWNGVKNPGSKGDGIGVYVSGTWYLRQTPSEGPPQIAPFAFGAPWYRPVVGDWNGDGVDGIGGYDSGNWYMRQTASPGGIDGYLLYGRATDRPVAGDWTVNGHDSPGVSRGSWWYLGTLWGPSSYQFPILPYL
jgi:hypothetical protein